MRRAGARGACASFSSSAFTSLHDFTAAHLILPHLDAGAEYVTGDEKNNMKVGPDVLHLEDKAGG
jgi:hypothetical protein